MILTSHLHDAAQVFDVHALRLNDLHYNTVHVGQLWVGHHGVSDDRRGGDIMYSTTCHSAGSGVVVVPLVADHPGLQLVPPALSGTCHGGTLVSGLLSGAFCWAQFQVYVLLARYGRCGGGRKGRCASKKAATIAGRTRG